MRRLDIVASSATRIGKTLFARILGDLALLRGGDLTFRMFDTAVPDGDIITWFPLTGQIVDPFRTMDQLRMLDPLLDMPSAPARQPWEDPDVWQAKADKTVQPPGVHHIIDLAQSATARFVDTLADTGFCAEAAAKGVSVTLWFMLDQRASAFKALSAVRTKLADARIVVVHQPFRRDLIVPEYSAEEMVALNCDAHIEVPILKPATLTHILNRDFSFRRFMETGGREEHFLVRDDLLIMMTRLYDEIETARTATRRPWSA